VVLTSQPTHDVIVDVVNMESCGGPSCYRNLRHHGTRYPWLDSQPFLTLIGAVYGVCKHLCSVQGETRMLTCALPHPPCSRKSDTQTGITAEKPSPEVGINLPKPNPQPQRTGPAGGCYSSMAQQLPGLRVPLMTTRRHPHHLPMQAIAPSSSIRLHGACCRPIPHSCHQLRAPPRRCYKPNQDPLMEAVLDITAAPAAGPLPPTLDLSVSSAALHLPSLAAGSAVDHLVAVQVPVDAGSHAPAAAAGVVPEGVLDPDSANPAYNRSGLNGLTSGGTSGLDTVRHNIM
jgi:hypothetical protein